MSILKYKELCKRIAKAEKFMDGPATLIDKDKWVPEFMNLIREQCELAERLGLTEEDCMKHMESVR